MEIPKENATSPQAGDSVGYAKETVYCGCGSCVAEPSRDGVPSLERVVVECLSCGGRFEAAFWRVV